jgi:hypothetical protein
MAPALLACLFLPAAAQARIEHHAVKQSVSAIASC